MTFQPAVLRYSKVHSVSIRFYASVRVRLCPVVSLFCPFVSPFMSVCVPSVSSLCPFCVPFRVPPCSFLSMFVPFVLVLFVCSFLSLWVPLCPLCVPFVPFVSLFVRLCPVLSLHVKCFDSFNELLWASPLVPTCLCFETLMSFQPAVLAYS